MVVLSDEMQSQIRATTGGWRLARIMQEIRIRVDWGPEKMP